MKFKKILIIALFSTTFLSADSSQTSWPLVFGVGIINGLIGAFMIENSARCVFNVPNVDQQLGLVFVPLCKASVAAGTLTFANKKFGENAKVNLSSFFGFCVGSSTYAAGRTWFAAKKAVCGL